MLNNELRPYEEYLDTELDWLGNIPEHWAKKTMREITKLSNRRCGFREDLELLSVYREYGVIRKKSRDDNHNVESLDLSNYKYVDKGYLVLNKMKMWQGSLGISKYEGIVSPAYIVCETKGDINLEYLHLLLRSPQYKTIYNRISYGVRVGQWDMRYDDFKKVNVYIPPKSEQDQIVKYLDYQLAKINKFIKAKKKLIAVFKERKQTIINDAVTKGLDPNVKMKASGIEWLGDVPDHWEKKRLKNLLKCQNNMRVPLSSSERGLMKSRQYDYYGASGIIDRVDGYIFDDELILIAEDGANLVSRNLKLAIIAKGKFWVNNHAHILKPMNNSLEYVAFLLESIDYRPYISGAAQPKLTKDRLLAIEVVVPFIDEQNAIVEYVLKETKILDDAMLIAQKEVELLIEYKNSLISDVVTGKVDVRNIIIEDNEGIDLDEDPIDEEILEAEDGEE